MARFSREKGIAGERELARLLQEAGYTVSGRVTADGTHDPLIALPSGEQLRFQVKRHERLRLQEWIAQGDEDAERDGTTSVIVFRQNRQPWYLAQRLDDWLRLIRG